MMTTAAHEAYPARLRASLDPGLSRWLWVVKWLLTLPHLVVLVFLWIAAFVLTVVAWFGILVNGRYPRGIFDFNVGVMRWTWRVSYYAFSGLGTDRYPPFTLKQDASYPADFEVDYPESLSRGLVLVKWWLLAIPHYVVVALISGGAGPHDGGLVAVLSLIAVVVLAVKGSYPRSLFDLVVGLNRWSFRVMAYAGLMTDTYPPFRLDMGGADPPE